MASLRAGPYNEWVRFVSHSLLVVFLVALATVGAARPLAVSAAPASPDRVILSLEHDFARFVGHRLDVSLDDVPMRGESALVEVDRAERWLERLRLRYISLLVGDRTLEIRHLVLLRLAELHLDLAARVRRIPAAEGLDDVEQQRWSQRLVQRAVPLEGIGLGMLDQIARLPAGASSVERFRARAHLYTVLHGGDGSPLGPTEVATLRQELVRDGMFPAPRRLLEGRQVGRRAAR